MHLTDCFIPLFAYVSHFLKTVSVRQPPFDEVREAVLRLFCEGETKAGSGEFSREEVDQARFALCAWVDEAIVGSEWDRRDLWLKDQLQRRYFNTTGAGAEFFDRLDALGLHQREAREVFYLCLALGFTGRFCNPGDQPALAQLKESTLKLLLGTSVGLPPLDRGELFPEAYPGEGGRRGRNKHRPVQRLVSWVALVGPPLLFGALYLVFRFTLGSIGDNFLKAVAN